MIKEPPKTFFGVLAHLGPSVILSASIVGSGELIMTTTLGAKAGFVALWVVILSCLVKVCVQLEFGKHAICSRETTMVALNSLPGPRPLGWNWTIWAWLVTQVVIVVQYGGIAEGLGQALRLWVPDLPTAVGVVVSAAVTVVLLLVGYYSVVERTSLALMVGFTAFTMLCVVLLQATPYRIEWPELLEGLKFRLPPEAFGVAVAAFGLTGVGASEIIAYPYWCLEKGYGVYTGPYEASEAWTRRARGWVRVMYCDAVLSMVIYTLVTAAFYVLGAAVLHERGEVPSQHETMQVLSRIYTEAAGPWAMAVYLAGAIVVLYSTLFAGTAGWTRTFADAFAQAGWLDYTDERRRRRCIRALAVVLPIAWAVAGLTYRAPVLMVKAGGIANAMLLLVVVYAALVFRYRKLPEELQPGWFYDTCLWLSVLSIIAAAAVSLARVLGYV